MRDGICAALLGAAVCLASFPVHAQSDGKKTILEQLREAPKLKEEQDARDRKRKEEEEARLRAREKLSPAAREDLECKELEEQSQRTMFCKRHYVRQGYKDAWVADTVLDGGLVIMEGPRAAAFCVRPIVSGSITPCEPLARIYAKPPRDQRATQECKDLEKDAGAPEKCRSTYLRQGYKDVWRSGELSSFIVMQGNGSAVICFEHVKLSTTSRCQPLRRLP